METGFDFTNSESERSAFMLSERLKVEMAKVLVGQENMLELLLAGLLVGGHVLIEGVPGVAKTLTAKLLARCIDVDFSRIQFTPDLMPSDITGTSVFNAQSGAFQFKRGPVFSNIVLIDEINRAPAKTQAALFEVMEERQITMDGETHVLDHPFMVVATQNPIEHEGTYRLPEAQLDRFLIKIEVKYPNLEEEVQILARQQQMKLSDSFHALHAVVHPSELSLAKQEVQSVHIEESLLRYIAQIVHSTRSSAALFVGASPRASIALLQVSKAIAVLRGRHFVVPEDVLFALGPVLRHRVVLTPEKEMDGISADQILQDIASRVAVPR